MPLCLFALRSSQLSFPMDYPGHSAALDSGVEEGTGVGHRRRIFQSRIQRFQGGRREEFRSSKKDLELSIAGDEEKEETDEGVPVDPPLGPRNMLPPRVITQNHAHEPMQEPLKNAVSRPLFREVFPLNAATRGGGVNSTVTGLCARPARLRPIPGELSSELCFHVGRTKSPVEKCRVNDLWITITRLPIFVRLKLSSSRGTFCSDALEI